MLSDKIKFKYHSLNIEKGSIYCDFWIKFSYIFFLYYLLPTPFDLLLYKQGSFKTENSEQTSKGKIKYYWQKFLYRDDD